MSVIIRASGWEIVSVIISLWHFFKELYRDRRAIFNGLRLALSALARLSKIGTGAFAVFIGGTMIVAPPALAVDFYRQMVRTPADVAPTIFGFSIASLLYLVGGAYRAALGI